MPAKASSKRLSDMWPIAIFGLIGLAYVRAIYRYPKYHWFLVPLLGIVIGLFAIFIYYSLRRE